MRSNGGDITQDLDVVIVGAGFAGLYQLKLLREQGFGVKVLEAGSDIGGVWYWNRYPGARCDLESIDYSYSFDPDLDQEWRWTERFATQPEIEQYLHHVAEKYDLRRDIQLGTRVKSARFDDARSRWVLTTETGEEVSASFCVMATGGLSRPNLPNIPGSDTFEGFIAHTAQWPREPVDLTGRVAIVGAGSSGIQATPVVAETASSLIVFQRTPNYAVPAKNRPISAEEMEALKATYPERRAAVRETFFGSLVDFNDQSALEVGEDERERNFLERWDQGSFNLLRAYNDLMVNEEANETVADFITRKIHERVDDPNIAESLTPKGYPAGAKRMCVESGYYEAFNRDNVTLVSQLEEPITEITETSIRTAEREFEVDTIIVATGFDAFTGALTNIDIRGRKGKELIDQWSHGPSAYLGLMVHDFPNLFLITGPGSPSLLSNVVHSIEQHVEWTSDCLGYLREKHYDLIDADEQAEKDWMALVEQVASRTLYPRANSFYMGANIPGKTRMFMAYLGGVNKYREVLEGVASDNYAGFTLSSSKYDSVSAA